MTSLVLEVSIIRIIRHKVFRFFHATIFCVYELFIQIISKTSKDINVFCSSRYSFIMLLLRLTSYIAFLIQLKQIVCLPNGAPVSTCSTLMPVHAGGAILEETSQSLFRVSPQAQVVGQGQILRIEIPSEIPSLSIKGFMIHARTPNGKIVGRFASSADGLVKLIDCEGSQDTATHSNTSPKVDFGLDWQAPTDYLGDVVFKYDLHIYEWSTEI